jgi:hypothetical protein
MFAFLVNLIAFFRSVATILAILTAVVARVTEALEGIEADTAKV